MPENTLIDICDKYISKRESTVFPRIKLCSTRFIGSLISEMASPTQWTSVWVNSGSWWWTGRPGVLRFMGSQRVGHDWVTELNWTELNWIRERPYNGIWKFNLTESEWGMDYKWWINSWVPIFMCQMYPIVTLIIYSLCQWNINKAVWKNNINIKLGFLNSNPSKETPLSIKIRLVKAMVFPVVMYGCESWTIKKAKCWRIDAFELWCWRKLLRVPWTARRSNSPS